ncbi:MAG: PKD domain-containing protein [Cyclobacteriaceae bacterium]
MLRAKTFPLALVILRTFVILPMLAAPLGFAVAGVGLSETSKLSNAVFIENKGQWPASVRYAADIPGGRLYFEQDGLTYAFNDQNISHNHAGNLGSARLRTKSTGSEATSIKVKFENANLSSLARSGEAITQFNYYIGNDPDRWGEGCRAYSTITYQNLYEGIDLHFYTSEKGLKYDLNLSEGADPSQIKFAYSGQVGMHIEDECLFLNTGQGTITENRPIAYQQNKDVAASYRLDKNIMSFEFPQGYDPSKPLTIDPELIFSTFSGSISDNFGYTACFDDSGNLYSGGIVFGSNFPTTVGSFYAGGHTDNLILKYDSLGENLLYATFLGGLSEEAPHSLVVDNSNELLIMGSTGSPNFPTSFSAYDRTFNGGDTVAVNGSFSGPDMTLGTDIFITKLDENGRLTASTFMGSEGNDGLLNMRRIREYNTPLIQNYGDYQRGDIIMDEEDNVYISSFTDGEDFPTDGGFQKQYGGGNNDAVVFSLNSDLSELRWSSYLGGTNDDAAYSIKLDQENNVFLGGGTMSSDFPITSGAINTSYKGSIDGFITKISASGDSILQSTFLGTSNYDQAYFIDIDADQNVYAFGQTRGFYPVTPGTFSVSNSGQFIHKLSPNLDSTIFSLVFGSGSREPNISPTAFLANECENIFLSGWGGIVNNGNSGNSGNTFNMPITNDALYSQTDGSDFYLMVLSADGSELLYSTYFGSTDTQNGDHVDGGTSRFDKRGIMYQSVCSCGGLDDDFPTTPGAYARVNTGTIFSPQGNVDRCNNAAFKFDLASLDARFDADKLVGCVPLNVSLVNRSIGGEQVIWEFGDNQQASNIDTLTHAYDTPGTYEITLTILDENTCIGVSSATKTVQVFDIDIQLSAEDSVCTGDQYPLFATGGVNYQWSPVEKLDNPNISNPIALLNETTEFTVRITSAQGCVVDTAVTISAIPIVQEDISMTILESCTSETQYQFSNNTEGQLPFLWDFGDGTTSSEPNPFHTYDENGLYTVNLLTEERCFVEVSLQIDHKSFFIPNAFSPNGDGKNDFFEIISEQSYPLQVADRTGKLVYESSSYLNTWNGGDLSSGTYFYRLALPDGDCNGWVQLLR